MLDCITHAMWDIKENNLLLMLMSLVFPWVDVEI